MVASHLKKRVRLKQFAQQNPLVAVFCFVASCMIFSSFILGRPPGFQSNTSSSYSKSFKDALAAVIADVPNSGLTISRVEFYKPFQMLLCSECGCSLCNCIADTGMWAPVETAFFTTILTKDGNRQKRVVDIGANMGYFTSISASHGALVAAFEPMKNARILLEATMALNEFNDVTVYPYAIGKAHQSAVIAGYHVNDWAIASVTVQEEDNADQKAENGRRRSRALHGLGAIGGMTDDNSVLDFEAQNLADRFKESMANRYTANRRPFNREIPESNTLQITTVTLGEIVDWPEVDILKCDTEGYELEIFAGAWSFFEKTNVKNVIIEIKEFNSPAKRQLMADIFEKGKFTTVYNYKELPFQIEWEPRNFEIFDVTEYAKDPTKAIEFEHEDFVFTKETITFPLQKFGDNPWEGSFFSNDNIQTGEVSRDDNDDYVQ